MDETTTVTTEATPETEDVQTPNTTLAVVGGTLLGVAAVYLAGTAVRKFKAHRAAAKVAETDSHPVHDQP